MSLNFENSYGIKEKIKDTKIAILPLGAIEAHGPHLPLGTDTILAERMADKLAEKTGALILPSLPYGQVWSLRNFSGSINVSNKSLISILYDIGKSLEAQGFDTFVILSGHLGNNTAAKDASRSLFDHVPNMKVYHFFYPGMNEFANVVRVTESVHNSYFHACEIETSYMLYLAPEHVDMEKAITDIPDISMEADVTPTPWENFTNSGVLGDAKLASAEKGKYILTRVLENMVSILSESGRDQNDK